MSNTVLRIASPTEYDRIDAAYVVWGYQGGVSANDVIYIAERNTDLVGAVRRTQEHEVAMLRGMYVAPAHHRQGIGSRLLARFVKDLDETPCYCVPYSHLQAFYGRGGFMPISEETAPQFLRERLAAYRSRGLNMLVMYRS